MLNGSHTKTNKETLIAVLLSKYKKYCGTFELIYKTYG